MIKGEKGNSLILRSTGFHCVVRCDNELTSIEVLVNRSRKVFKGNLSDKLTLRLVSCQRRNSREHGRMTYKTYIT